MHELNTGELTYIYYRKIFSIKAYLEFTVKTYRIIVIGKKTLFLCTSIVPVVLLILTSVYISLRSLPANNFVDPYSGIIVIDAGHGGIDGGTSKGELLEKDVNLDVSMKIRTHLELRGYTVVLTRESDVSLDKLCSSGGSRHQRDLNARANIINNSNAQLFLSIHVNCNMKKPSTDGSIVFYFDKYVQNKDLAYCIQRSLNSMVIDGKKRTVHDPQKAGYYLLSHANLPGVIVETAFLSNAVECELLKKEGFRDAIAEAVVNGVELYLNKRSRVIIQHLNT